MLNGNFPSKSLGVQQCWEGGQGLEKQSESDKRTECEVHLYQDHVFAHRYYLFCYSHLTEKNILRSSFDHGCDKFLLVTYDWPYETY